MSDNPTPPGAMPTIRPGMRIAFSLESLTALIGGVIFCTIFYFKVDRLEQDMALVKKALGLTDIMGPPSPSAGTSHHAGANP